MSDELDPLGPNSRISGERSDAGIDQEPGEPGGNCDCPGGRPPISAFLVFIDFMSQHPSPYIGILAYMLMPGLMVFGLILIPFGMLLERRRRKKANPVPRSRSSLASTSTILSNERCIAGLVAFTVVFIAISDSRQLSSLRVYGLGTVLRTVVSYA